MISILISVVGILLTLAIVIGTHEAAHFAVARLVGVKVLKFSLGFGKALFRWHDKSGTEYVIALLPLGGYVKMLDTNETKVAPSELKFAYQSQPFYKKFLIVLAGPAANLLGALLLYWMIFTVGFTSIKPIIGAVIPSSIASSAELKPGLEIISIDKKLTPTWSNITFHLLFHLGDKDTALMTTRNLTNQQLQDYALDLRYWKLDDLNPDPLASLGITPYEPNIPLIIGIIAAHSPAAQAGLQLGDKIISIDKKKVSHWQEIITYITEHPEKNITLTIERKKKPLTLTVTIGSQRNLLWKKIGYLGIAPNYKIPAELLTHIQYPPLLALQHAFAETVDFINFNLLIFGKMVTGKISLHSLGGPVTIFASAGSALHYGWLAFCSFLAFLSIALGVINLFPIPGLDGGHLLIQIIESITRKSIPPHVLALFYRLGFIFIFFIFIQALVNDILRLM